jgi:hypothetical protein
MDYEEPKAYLLFRRLIFKEGFSERILFLLRKISQEEEFKCGACGIAGWRSLKL